MEGSVSFPLVLALSLIAIQITSSGVAEKSEPLVVAKFGGECSTAPFQPSQDLKRLIDKAVQTESFPSALPFGYSAFVFDLNGDRSDELFVPLSCGGTGNCKWGIFSKNPARLLGTFTAWFFYIHRRSGSWSRLSTYTREGGDQGEVAILWNRRGRYRPKSIRTDKGYAGNPQPFLKRMGIPKCS
jgi:hypothetical protein